MTCCKLPCVQFQKGNAADEEVVPSLITYLGHHTLASPYRDIVRHTNTPLMELKVLEVRKTFVLPDAPFYGADETTAVADLLSLAVDGIVRFETVHTLQAVQLLYALCAAYSNVHLYNSVLNVSSLERFAIVKGFKTKVAPPPYTFHPHLYFTMKVSELNTIFGQQQLDLMHTEEDLCGEWVQRYF